MAQLYHDDKIFAMPDPVKEPVVKPRLRIVNTAHHDIGRLQRLRDQVFKRLKLLVCLQHMKPTLGRQFDCVSEDIDEPLSFYHNDRILIARRRLRDKVCFGTFLLRRKACRQRVLPLRDPTSSSPRGFVWLRQSETKRAGVRAAWGPPLRVTRCRREQPPGFRQSRTFPFLHGGRIEISSQQGQGITMRLYLPIAV